jgi:hypothetical protein
MVGVCVLRELYTCYVFRYVFRNEAAGECRRAAVAVRFSVSLVGVFVERERRPVRLRASRETRRQRISKAVNGKLRRGSKMTDPLRTNKEDPTDLPGVQKSSDHKQHACDLGVL